MNLLTIPKNKFINRYLGKAEVLLTVCAHREIDIDIMRSLINLSAEKKHSFIWSPVIGDALIERARSRAASYFIHNTKADILLFIDDDIVFDPKNAIKLIDNVMDGADICGAPYIQKGTLGKTWVQFDNQEITFKKDAPIVEVEALGTGFLAIHRRVFTGMIEKLDRTLFICDKKETKQTDGSIDVTYVPVSEYNELPLCHPGTLNFYPFFCPANRKKSERWAHLGEDWIFMDRARRCGYKSFIDPSIFLGHNGKYIYNMADLLRLPKHRVEDIEITLK